MSVIIKIALHQLRFHGLFSSLGKRLALYLEIEKNYKQQAFDSWDCPCGQALVMIGNGIKNND